MHIATLIGRDGPLHQQAKGLVRDPDLPFPVLLAKFKLSWRCNLRCRMCNLWRYAHEGRGAGLDPETVKQALFDLHAQGLKKVHFSGGEVLMYPAFEEIVSFARALDLQVNLTSNGTLITKETARFLVDQRVHTLTVSIDAPDSRTHDRIRGVKGAFKAAIHGQTLVRERREKKGRGPKLAVNTVVTRATIDSLDELYRLLRANGVDAWRILPIDTEREELRPTGEQWQRLLSRAADWGDFLSRLPLDWTSERSGARAASGKYAGVFYGSRVCYAPWYSVFVDADGKIYPCCMGKGDMVPYANINEHTMAEALTAPGKKAIAYSMAAGHPFPVCHRCDDFLEENQAFYDLLHPGGDG